MRPIQAMTSAIWRSLSAPRLAAPRLLQPLEHQPTRIGFGQHFERRFQTRVTPRPAQQWEQQHRTRLSNELRLDHTSWKHGQQTRAFKQQRQHADQRRQYSSQRQQQHQQEYGPRPTTAFGWTLLRMRRWAARPTFYYEVGGLAVVVGGIYVYNLETVDVSGRRRFNILSDEQVAAMSQQQREEILRQYAGRVLPEYDPVVRQVERVLERLKPFAVGMQNASWRVTVLNVSEPNAFVLPGGDVFVFTGILPMCEDEDGVAAVLGHEIGHTVAKHVAEKLSQSVVMFGALVLGAFLFGIDTGISRVALDLAFSLPGSRAQESEADYIGLRLMSEACYDPRAATRLWRNMQKAAAGAAPQFLSTHPSSENREQAIEGWMPEALKVRESAGCAVTASQFDRFRNFRQPDQWPGNTWM